MCKLVYLSAISITYACLTCGSAMADNQRALLAQYQGQLAQVQAQATQCQRQVASAQQQMAINAMNGIMPTEQPCMAYMPQWISQIAFLETQIYRLQSGDYQTPSQQLMPNLGGGGSAPSTRNDGSNRDIDAVDNYTRQGIRGNSIYTDEYGQQHELPTQNYYFRDRSTGQTFGSDTYDPPSDGRDYERFRQ